MDKNKGGRVYIQKTGSPPKQNKMKNYKKKTFFEGLEPQPLPCLSYPFLPPSCPQGSEDRALPLGVWAEALPRFRDEQTMEKKAKACEGGGYAAEATPPQIKHVLKQKLPISAWGLGP